MLPAHAGRAPTKKLLIELNSNRKQNMTTFLDQQIVVPRASTEHRRVLII